MQNAYDVSHAMESFDKIIGGSEDSNRNRYTIAIDGFALLNFDDYATTAKHLRFAAHMNESVSRCDYNWIKLAFFFVVVVVVFIFVLSDILKSISSSEDG